MKNFKLKTISQFLTGLVVGALLVGVITPLVAPNLFGRTSGDNPYPKPYPLPNQYWSEGQDYYVFASGGQQGGLYVYSIPAMKQLAQIPVFATNEAWSWSPEDTAIAAMLTNPWTGKLATKGDTRQVSPSRTDNIYDARWIFTSDLLNPRIARVDLDTFQTGDIYWLPNVNGGLNSVAVNSDTSLLAVTFEHSQYPETSIRDYLGLEISELEGPYVGGFGGVDIDTGGQMHSAWQVWTPWQMDAVRFGWGPSDGWLLTTTYNTEREEATFSMLGNIEDYVFFWNLESIQAALDAGNYIVSDQDPNTPIIRWQDVEVYAAPVPTNPSGLDISPTGKYVFSGGKAASEMAVIDFDLVAAAIKSQSFSGEDFGVPILDSLAVRATTLDLGLGPTHTEFDDRGNAYVGSFVDSVIWKVPMAEPYLDLHGETPWKIADTIDTHYSVVHPMIPGGDTAQPSGQYLLAINKLGKNTFLPHGPLHGENHELFDISGDRGLLVDQMSIGPESHAARAISVELLQDQILGVYPRQENKETPRVEYDYDAQEVRVYMDVVRSFFAPDWFSVPQGWTVKLHLNSLEQALDISHGLAIDSYNIAMSLEPGAVRQIEFVADEPGVYWFYCLWYCSELHKEMRGRMIVIPLDEWTTELERK